jgi:polyisoprenoid-binding protein YceI
MSMKYSWRADASHSTIAFTVSYMLLGVITGEFRQFGGTVLSSDSFDDMEIDISVDVRSMTTFHRERDEGMLSANVFDADTWPVIRFVSSSFRRVSSGGLFEVKGLLTIRGFGIPLDMMVSLASFGALAGAAGNASGILEAVFTFSGNLYRSDFGLGGLATPEQGNVADEVNFFGEVRFQRSFAGG